MHGFCRRAVLAAAAIGAAVVVLPPCGQARAAGPSPAAHGVTVRNGTLYRHGKWLRAIGVNYCDLFQDMIHHPARRRTLKGLRFLGSKKIPFVRFWCCGFWPSDWDLYFADKGEWFRRMDLVVRAAEQARVGLVPCLFWRAATYPDLFDEYNDPWADPASKTRRFMRDYVKEVVTRYRDSAAVWGWEFSNEMNLDCDLPNGMEFLGREIPALKVKLAKHRRNLMTCKIAGAAFEAFAREVRKHDPHRFVTTGNSIPRSCGWHNATEKSWKADSRQQALEVFRWMSPAPMDVASVHFYPPFGKPPAYAEAKGVRDVLGRCKEFARKLGQPLFVGEFAAAAHDKAPKLTMAHFRSRQTAILDALLAVEADLAAYWVFDYTADRKGPGLVRKDNEYAWILDQIAEYNARIAVQAGPGKVSAGKEPRKP